MTLSNLPLKFAFALASLLAGRVSAGELFVLPSSLVSRDGRQSIRLDIRADRAAAGARLVVLADGAERASAPLPALAAGTNACSVLLPLQAGTPAARWQVRDAKGQTLAETNAVWSAPRHWTLYLLSSTHADIGLHEPQYVQRRLAVDTIGAAQTLIDAQPDDADPAAYRYVMEGTWYWNNYLQDKGEKAARFLVTNSIRRGRLDIGATCAGNHTQVYGFEELCRSAYTRRWLRETCAVTNDTMLMTDNNGLSWGIVAPYAEAGIRNLLWSPNQWNPLPSTLVPYDKSYEGYTWNPDAGGGGSRVDVRWKSPLPMLFWWQAADGKSRMLVWTATQYDKGAYAFGYCKYVPRTLDATASILAQHLAQMEKRYPVDVWLMPNYSDNEWPNQGNSSFCRDWNAKWRWPVFKTVGDLSEPFNRVREKFGDQLATLRGDITGGWAQHPVATPELLAQKFAADRRLATAEKWSALAAWLQPTFLYPRAPLARAWWALICNDEHSYGTSGYQGRRVFETWMQHRDWIDTAAATAESAGSAALAALARRIPAAAPSLVLFNPTLTPRREIITLQPSAARALTPEVPPFGYRTVPVSELQAVPEPAAARVAAPPVVSNRFYRLAFAADGSIASLRDCELKRELLGAAAPYRCNQFVYTEDNHKSFVTPSNAVFTVAEDSLGITVTATTAEPRSGAAIIQRVTLPANEKRVEIENDLSHVRALFNTHRYDRYGYYAFPFLVPGGTFRVQLNGPVATPKTDQTGHGTDAYLAAREWAGVENGSFGVALVQLDSQLVEFGHIHADKTDFGRPYSSTHLYSYLFNDWLQMHVPNGRVISPRFRYVITSFAGDWRAAHIPAFAERVRLPLDVVRIPAQAGDLPPARSFLSVREPNVRLLAFKAAEEPGRGFIVRLQETEGRALDALKLKQSLGEGLALTRCSVIEDDLAPSFRLDPFGTATFRIVQPGQTPAAPAPVAGRATDSSLAFSWQPVPGAAQYAVYGGDIPDFAADTDHLLTNTLAASFTERFLSPGQTRHYRVTALGPARQVSAASPALTLTTAATGDSAPAPIGSVYTGLLARPRAGHGERQGQLYLLWGQNTESDLAHYELYRSETAGFAPSAATFVTNVPPGIYREARHIDLGLQPDTRYFYRVRAVDRAGHAGPFSEEFSGLTREGPEGLAVYDSAEPNYHPVLDSGSWRVAVLNSGDRTTAARAGRFEKHLATDEAFILVRGEATLIIGDARNRVPMTQDKLYNVEKGTWHQIVTQPGAKLFLIENRGTSAANTRRRKE